MAFCPLQLSWNRRRVIRTLMMPAHDEPDFQAWARDKGYTVYHNAPVSPRFRAGLDKWIHNRKTTESILLETNVFVDSNVIGIVLQYGSF